MFVNLTPHDIHYAVSNDPRVPLATLPRSEKPARVQEWVRSVGEHEGALLCTVTYGPVENLPEPVEGTIYIVSGMVRSALPERADLASPGGTIRDGNGRVVGCRDFYVNGAHWRAQEPVCAACEVLGACSRCRALQEAP